jgi:hypothetical protein
MAFIDSGDTALTALDTIMAQQANVIGPQVYRDTLHVTPWLDLFPQSGFPENQGYQLTTLIYDRSIPTKDTAGSNAGVKWANLAVLQSGNRTFGTSTKEGEQPLDSATNQTAGPFGGDDDGDGSITDNDTRSFIRFTKKLKPYFLQRAEIESPKFSLEDLFFATQRDQQLDAITESLTEATRYTIENRNRDEFMRLAGNLVPCLSTSSPILRLVDSDSNGTANNNFEGVTLGDSNGNAVTLDLNTSGASNADVASDANISNAVLDKVYNVMNRQGAGLLAYGRENGRPVYSLVLSSEASYNLMTEAGYRDDVRLNSSKVSDLIAPLGIERSFRGFYHVIDDLAPRYNFASGVPTRVLPYTVSSGVMNDNTGYDSATHEVAFVLHPQVLETQVPSPKFSAKGISFDPVSFRGEFRWTNIKHPITNPDGLIGYFRSILGMASKPIKTHFGYVVLFKRGASPAAV